MLRAYQPESFKFPKIAQKVRLLKGGIFRMKLIFWKNSVYSLLMWGERSREAPPCRVCSHPEINPQDQALGSPSGSASLAVKGV